MVNDTQDRIEGLFDRAEPRMARILRTGIETLKKELDLKLIERLISQGDIEGAVDLVIRIGQQIGTLSTQTFITAGQDTTTFLQNAGLGRIAFDQLGTRAVGIMRENQFNLVAQFTNEQRNAVRSVISEGIAEGLGPRQQARNFRNAIGLTEKQTQAVQNYRRILGFAGNPDIPLNEQKGFLERALRDKRSDSVILRAIQRNNPLSGTEVDRMTARYAQNYVRYRSEVIARTESLRAVHQGVEEAYNQAIDNGLFEADQIEQKWVTARDARVRDSHRKLNGEKRPFGGTWQGDFGTLRYPGDPAAPPAETIQCRCVVVRRIKKPT